MDDLDREIRDALASALGVQPDCVGPDATSRSLAQWDSLRHVLLMMELERRFGVRLPLERIPEAKSFAAIRSLIEALRG